MNELYKGSSSSGSTHWKTVPTIRRMISNERYALISCFSSSFSLSLAITLRTLQNHVELVLLLLLWFFVWLCTQCKIFRKTNQYSIREMYNAKRVHTKISSPDIREVTAGYCGICIMSFHTNQTCYQQQHQQQVKEENEARNATCHSHINQLISI